MGLAQPGMGAEAGGVHTSRASIACNLAGPRAPPCSLPPWLLPLPPPPEWPRGCPSNLSKSTRCLSCKAAVDIRIGLVNSASAAIWLR
eukprot:12908317-Prorocentrum_lima.AAC.1